jgi:hypothetical protein
MPHVFEPASSGRSKCRGCGNALERGAIRFGERLPNPYAEGEMTLWFHPMCAAYKRPEAMLEALATTEGVADRVELDSAARASGSQARLQRIDGAERAKGQANCRHCREPIPKGAWRIRLTFFEEGRFNPAGFIHIACAKPYFNAVDLVDHVLHFSANLPAADAEEVRSALR